MALFTNVRKIYFNVGLHNRMEEFFSLSLSIVDLY
jgi:hypothetical protein